MQRVFWALSFLVLIMVAADGRAEKVKLGERVLSKVPAKVSDCKHWAYSSGLRSSYYYSFSIIYKIQKQVWIEQDEKIVPESFKEVETTEKEDFKDTQENGRQADHQWKCSAQRDGFVAQLGVIN